MGWFGIEHSGAASIVVPVYVSIRLRDSVSLSYLREIHHSEHDTTAFEPRLFTDWAISTMILISNFLHSGYGYGRVQTDKTRVRWTRWQNQQRSQLRSLMVWTTRAGVWKLKYSCSRSRFLALLMVQWKHWMQRLWLSFKPGRSSMQLHSWPFSWQWSGHSSSCIAFRMMQWHIGISSRSTTCLRRSWICEFCEMRCQL